MESNTFRPDLYYRLNVATLTMPPLRACQEDIPLLVEHFLTKAACRMNMPPKRVSPEVIEYLGRQDWPGNVRQLENRLMGWVALTEGDQITMEHIPRETVELPKTQSEYNIETPYKALKEAAIRTFTRSYLDRLLDHTNGNVSLAAQISGIKRQSLQKIIKRYRIPVHRFRN